MANGARALPYKKFIRENFALTPHYFFKRADIICLNFIMVFMRAIIDNFVAFDPNLRDILLVLIKNPAIQYFITIFSLKIHLV